MKERRIKFDDVYLLDGAMEIAKENKMKLSDYVISLIEKDVKEKKGYKLVAYYENGETSEEDSLYTRKDMMLSVNAYKSLMTTGEMIEITNSRIIGYRAYQKEVLLIEGGETWDTP